MDTQVEHRPGLSRRASISLIGLAVLIAVGLALLAGLFSPSHAAALSPQAMPTDSLPADTPASSNPQTYPTLTDFWNGAAQWVLDVPDTGLPVGESDTLYMGNDIYWSYLHASTQSAGISDTCGGTVDFPGCVTRWISTDGGQHFTLNAPTCILRCNACPCAEEDLTRQQQYPRVARSRLGMFYMLFEHDAQIYLTTSLDGLDWIRPHVNTKTGIWKATDGPCSPDMAVGPHPSFVTDYACMAGGPPGILIYGDRLFEFIGLGQNPGHMGCNWSWLSEVTVFVPCSANPLFTGALDYGPLDASGADANPYFDFRYMTSADVIRDGNYWYMTYEGVRGPSSAEAGRDNQFGLGFARSSIISGAWEKYPGNPALQDVADNWGVGHADILVVDGITYMYTATPSLVRGRYVLMYK
jgi:hypothetical protein